MSDVAKINLQEPSLSDDQQIFWKRCQQGQWISLMDFVAFVLSPHIATMLIASELDLSEKKANSVRNKSKVFGETFYGEEDDGEAQGIASRAAVAVKNLKKGSHSDADVPVDASGRPTPRQRLKARPVVEVEVTADSTEAKQSSSATAGEASNTSSETPKPEVEPVSSKLVIEVASDACMPGRFNRKTQKTGLTLKIPASAQRANHLAEENSSNAVVDNSQAVRRSARKDKSAQKS